MIAVRGDGTWDSTADMIAIYGPQECEIAESSGKLELDKPFTLPKGHEPLTHNKLFTQDSPSIGIKNVNNIDGILAPYERMIFFAQLLANKHRASYGGSILAFNRRSKLSNGLAYRFVYKDGTLNWQLENSQWNSGSIFDMIANLYGIDNLHLQIEKLVGVCELDFSSLSQVKLLEQNRLLDGNTQFQDYTPVELDMFDVTKQHNKAVMRHRTDIVGAQGELLTTLLMYEWQDNFFCIPASLEYPISTYNGSKLPILTIGKHIAPAVFINQNYFSKYPCASVIFCQDIRLAMKLDELLRHDSSYDPSEFFITGIFSFDFSKYNWYYLHRRNVLFCPAPTAESLALVKLYKKYSDFQGYGSFKVLDHFILPYPKSTHTKNVLSNAEKYILDQSASLSDDINIYSFLRSKINHALTVDEFTKIYQSLGIFKRKSSESVISQERTRAPLAVTLTPADPDWELPMPRTLNDVRINHILKPGNLILLIGIKNAGKTRLSYLLLESTLHLQSTLPLFSSHVGAPFANIMLIDGESEERELNQNLIQHGLGQDIDIRLHVISRFQETLPPWAENFTLTDVNFRNGLIHELQQKQCRILVLDNLTDLLGSAVNYENKANEIINWIRQLQKDGVCVILLHHKSADNSKTNSTKTDGSQIFKKLSRTIINVFGVKEIIANELGTKDVQNFAKESGLTAGIEFAVCKYAPILDNVTIWAHLPFGAQEWKYICTTDRAGNEVDWCPNSGISTTVLDTQTFKKSTSIEEIHPKASRVYNALLAFGDYVKIGNIVSKFQREKGMGEDTIRKILKDLHDNGSVDIRGNNQGTTYKAIS